MNKLLVVVILMVSLISTPGLAFKNECKSCGLASEAEDLICQNCGEYLNLCLICQQPNPVRNDSCEICCNPLVESRILSAIPPDVRDDYKLGQSPRASLERENSQIQCFLGRNPDQEARLLFQLGLNLKRMKFSSREAEAWGNFLAKFPTHPEAPAARVHRSEALRNWGYLFFRDGDLVQAHQRLQEAVAENPQSVDALVWLGRVELAMGNISEARHVLKAALGIDPGDRRARYLLKADPRNVGSLPSREAKETVADPLGGRYEATRWFPRVDPAGAK